MKQNSGTPLTTRVSVKWATTPRFVQRAAQSERWRGLYSLSSIPVYLRGAGEFLSLLRWINALPTLDVALSPEQQLRFNSLLLTGIPKLVHRGWARTVIRLPEDVNEFFRGQDRRNLRTGARGAEREGFHAEWVTGAELFEALASIVQQRGWGEPLTMAKFTEMVGATPEESHAVVVRNAEGRADCINIGVCCHDIFVLRVGLTTTKSFPRWLAFNRLVYELHNRGVRLLIGDQITALTAGNIEFQSHVGFEIVNIRYHTNQAE